MGLIKNILSQSILHYSHPEVLFSYVMVCGKSYVFHKRNIQT